MCGACAASWYVRSSDSSTHSPTTALTTMTASPVAQPTQLASCATANAAGLDAAAPAPVAAVPAAAAMIASERATVASSALRVKITLWLILIKKSVTWLQRVW